MVDEYELEIQQLQRRIAALKFKRADPVVIEELELQLRILQAIYRSTWRTFEAGEAQEALRDRFRELDLGNWTFENVYFYVYDEAVQLEAGDLAAAIERQDYVALLNRRAVGS
jgi:predicted Zn-dependent protease